MHPLRRLGLAAALALAAGGATAEAPGMCKEPGSPVLLVLVEAAAKVAPAAQDLSKTNRLVSTQDTVIFADGRAVTSNLGAVSEHLNALGWATRPIEIAGAGTSSRLPPQGASGRRRG